jgi:hypothetical protein
MSDSEIEIWANLAICFIGGWFVGYTVGWWIFVPLFNIIDDYLHS